MPNATRTQKQQNLATAAIALADKLASRGRYTINTYATFDDEGNPVDVLGKFLAGQGYAPNGARSSKEAVAEFLGVPQTYFTAGINKAISAIVEANDDLEGSERRQALATGFRQFAAAIRNARLVKRNEALNVGESASV